MSAADRARALALTVGGLGHMRPFPGTWGSTPPPALVAAMVLLGAPAWSINTALAVVCALACFACVRLGAWGERRWGRKDASQIVADETAGQCIPLLGLPAIAEPLTAGGLTRLAALLLAAFVLFRLFDIVKVQPAHAAQRLRAGWGVLLDDLVAGVYAAIVLRVGVAILW